MTKVEENMKAIKVFLIIVLLYGGIQSLVKLGRVILMCLKEAVAWLNEYLIVLNEGKGIIPTLFTHPTTYWLVGVTLSYIPFSKIVKSTVGKMCYWLISGIVSILLIYINNIIFK